MTTGSAPDTWNSRDLPVLREAVRLLDGDAHRAPSALTIGSNLQMSDDDVQRALSALSTGGLIDTVGSFGRIHMDIIRVTGEGRRLAGAWPSPESGLDRMVAALEAIAANVDLDDDTRNRAGRILEALSGDGRQLGVGVTTAVVTGELPAEVASHPPI